MDPSWYSQIGEQAHARREKNKKDSPGGAKRSVSALSYEVQALTKACVTDSRRVAGHVEALGAVLTQPSSTFEASNCGRWRICGQLAAGTGAPSAGGRDTRWNRLADVLLVGGAIAPRVPKCYCTLR
jgi:hypothetical protein